MTQRYPSILVPALCVPLLIFVFAASVPSAESPAASPVTPATQNQEKPKSMILGDNSSVWEVFLRGGWCMWPILGCSIVGLAFFFERFIELRHKNHIQAGFDKRVIETLEKQGAPAARALCLDNKSSLARVLHATLQRHGTSRQEMEQTVQEEGQRLLFDLRNNCRWIGIMSNMAPLWGLLGTVLGLIECFDQVSGAGMGKAEALATGVAVALLTTAFGLIVAIPLLTLYHLVKGKADNLVREIEELSVNVVLILNPITGAEAQVQNKDKQ